ELEEKANSLYSTIEYLNKYAKISIENGLSQVGGGSMPLETIDSKVIAITPNNMNVAMLEKKLRLSDAHIIARVYDDKYVLDARTIFEDEFEIVKNELEKALIGG
ncbi:MAG: L-seryl-tRNA(Sec) selenium transferase, partial [Paraclostridium sp.]